MDNFDYETPYLTVLGIGRIDCRNKIDFQPLAQSYAHTDPAIYEGRDAAIKDFAHGGQTSNPYRQWMRPLKWTAWNLGYAFWMKNLRCN